MGDQAINELDVLINKFDGNSNQQLIQKNNVIKKIAIVYAMEDEAKPLISRLNLVKNDKYSLLLSPFIVYSNNSESIFISCNGKCPQYKCDRIGTQWVSILTFMLLKHIKPDIMLNAGTSGGIIPKYAFQKFDKNYDEKEYDINKWPDMQIGDVFIGSNVIYSDRRIPIPQWKSWDIGNYQLFAYQYLQKQLNLPIATIATSNAFDYTSHDREIYKKHNVLCKEMECAAIAEICNEFKTKFIAIKGVTDFVEHHDGEHFLSNLSKTVNNVTNVMEKILQLIIGKSMQEIQI